MNKKDLFDLLKIGVGVLYVMNFILLGIGYNLFELILTNVSTFLSLIFIYLLIFYILTD